MVQKYTFVATSATELLSDLELPPTHTRNKTGESTEGKPRLSKTKPGFIS
jgi:hypothetical protein